MQGTCFLMYVKNSLGIEKIMLIWYTSVLAWLRLIFEILFFTGLYIDNFCKMTILRRVCMLILGLVVVLIAFVVFLVLRVKYPSRHDNEFDTHSFFTFMSWVLGLVALTFIINIWSLSIEVATESTIDSKIAMYQEENANIERDIDKIVREYLEHEHNTFADLKTEESSITLVTLFPELKADTLVQQQLEIYVANNASIKQLREEKINMAKTKWILYFGR